METTAFLPATAHAEWLQLTIQSVKTLAPPHLQILSHSHQHYDLPHPTPHFNLAYTQLEKNNALQFLSHPTRTKNLSTL